MYISRTETLVHLKVSNLQGKNYHIYQTFNLQKEITIYTPNVKKIFPLSVGTINSPTYKIKISTPLPTANRIYPLVIFDWVQ